MAQVFLGLGSNIDKRKNLNSALNILRQKFDVRQVSRVYRSAAVGFSGDDFFNLVVELQTDVLPPELLQQLKIIEAEHGRSRGEEKFSARTLDIDILTYEQQVGTVAGIELPRDEIVKYAFVLRPLAEIAGDQVHPQTGESFAQMWQQFDQQQQPLEEVQLNT